MKYKKFKRVLTTILAISSVLSSYPVLGSTDALSNVEELTLDEKERNSVNLLNYLTALVQEINTSSDNLMVLEEAYSKLYDNTEPSIIDDSTLYQCKNILDTIQKYRITEVKRERLEYIHEQNKANAIHSAVPNPLAILNLVQSDSIIKSLASTVYLVYDSINSYTIQADNADMKYLQDSWELDDKASQDLHDVRSNTFSYMVDIARKLPEGITMSEQNINEFVSWKNEENVTSRLRWLETTSNRDIYKNYSDYWLVLTSSYYQKALENDPACYKKCLDSIKEYEKLNVNIFRFNKDLAKVLPCVIDAAKECLSETDYITTAIKYANMIVENTTTSDWDLRYFVAQIYLDIYSKTKDDTMLHDAFDLVYDNVNELKNEQIEQNKNYLNKVQTLPTKNISKEEKENNKKYNEYIKNKRKTELSPVYEPLKLNCDLLFALAKKLNISDNQKMDIDNILHPNENPLFLNTILDSKYRFYNLTDINTNDVKIKLHNTKIDIPLSIVDNIASKFMDIYLEIPAMYFSDISRIEISVRTNKGATKISDYEIRTVDRHKSSDITDHTVFISSDTLNKFDLKKGHVISIFLYSDSSDDYITFRFNVAKNNNFIRILNTQEI